MPGELVSSWSKLPLQFTMQRWEMTMEMEKKNMAGAH